MKIAKYSFCVILLALFSYACSPTESLSKEEAIALTVAAIDMGATRVALEQRKIDVSPIPTETEPAPRTLMSDPNISVTEAVLYEGDGIIIQVHSIDYEGLMGPQLLLLIENGMTNAIDLTTSDVVVNGFMIDTALNAKIMAGETRVEALVLPGFELDVSQIETIQYVEFCFQIVDSETWNKSIVTERLRVETTAIQALTQNLSNPGRFILEREGVRIALNKNEDEKLFIYIENNTDIDITVKTLSLLINATQTDGVFEADVIAGAKIHKELLLQSLDISRINEIGFQIQVIRKLDGRLIFETEAMTMRFD